MSRFGRRLLRLVIRPDLEADSDDVTSSGHGGRCKGSTEHCFCVRGYMFVDRVVTLEVQRYMWHIHAHVKLAFYPAVRSSSCPRTFREGKPTITRTLFCHFEMR
jgi:hypothetical protein